MQALIPNLGLKQKPRKLNPLPFLHFSDRNESRSPRFGMTNPVTVVAVEKTVVARQATGASVLQPRGLPKDGPPARSASHEDGGRTGTARSSKGDAVVHRRGPQRASRKTDCQGFRARDDDFRTHRDKPQRVQDGNALHAIASKSVPKRLDSKAAPIQIGAPQKQGGA